MLEAPLSFWGGTDAVTGRIVDERHPQRGLDLRGSVLALPAGRGSSSSSSVLAEAIRAGTAPVAVLLGEPDVIIVLGAMVAAELYDRHCPVVHLPPQAYAGLPAGRLVEVVAGDVSEGRPARVSATEEVATP